MTTAQTAAPARPNILMIMADELVASLTGAYGHPVVQTPNLDELVRRGVRFDAAYSPAPLCAPARACLMSGQYTSTNRVYDNAALFAADIPCVGHYLTNAGYDCVLSGKMHFVGPDQLHGLRRRLTTDIYAEEFNMLDNRAPWSVARDPGPLRPRGRAGAPRPELRRLQRARRALAPPPLLRRRGPLPGPGVPARPGGGEGRWPSTAGPAPRPPAPSGPRSAPPGASTPRPDELQPWFLCVSYHHPHEPFWPPQDVWDLYEGAEIEIPAFPEDLESRTSAMDRWLNANHGIRHFAAELRSAESLTRVRRAYYALVTYIDRKVGELIATLKEHGLWEDTVIVFSSDHGDMLVREERWSRSASSTTRPAASP